MPPLMNIFLSCSKWAALQLASISIHLFVYTLKAYGLSLNFVFLFKQHVEVLEVCAYTPLHMVTDNFHFLRHPAEMLIYICRHP